MRSRSSFGAKDTKRLVFIACFVFFLFCLIVIQYYKLQISEGNKWRKIASAQHHLDVTEYFMRGGFYSNTDIKEDHPDQKVPFVVEVPKFHLYIDPNSIDVNDKLIIAKKLFEYFNFTSSEKENIFCEFFKKSRSRKIISWIDKDKKDEIIKWWQNFSKEKKIVRNAIFFVGDYKRCYPFGPLLGQILHTVQDQKDPISFQSLPTGGLELYFNDHLKGQLGRRIITRSSRHPLDTGKVIDKPQDGSDVYLTINHYLQAIAEEELDKGVKIANAKSGWAIMMDPYTGQILALAQSPTFDVTRYRDYFNDESLKETTKLKALVDLFEPGSIFKPITLAICLKANDELEKMGKEPIFYPDEKIAASNGNFPGRSKPIKDARVHKFLNMNLGIQKSSNIYIATLVDRLINTLGEKWYQDSLIELFGFSKKTGIEFPFEADGFVPQVGKFYPNKAPQWSKSTPYSLAMGYNILVNSIQIARAFAIIANGGKDVQPTLFKKIVKNIDGKERVILDNTKNFDFQKMRQIINPEHCKIIKKATKYITKIGGTSRLADIPGYSEAGKSGTAEKIVDGKYNKDIHISSFIGFVPVEKPSFVLMIVIDEPEKKYVPGLGSMQLGGVCAAPIFKDIATRALKYLGVAPDDPFGYPYPDPRRDAAKADWADELKQLSELYKSWNER
ncbi:MAG: Penicillin-binding protein 2 [Candidatus Anoxychlamydiales bacterium]|nr:Penicillin-binding protein 2 [Candidatus Anoxychlamydiales bacterium]NGX36337.1 Penicillin-binding protein 2 [Candidatus Anoxychlamydiales bacterium]